MEKNLLEIKDLYKVYNPSTAGEVIALDNISFSINEGDFITIVGSNAAGKSTLFNALAGSLSVTSGDIFLEGKSIITTPEYARARFFSRVRQNPNESVIPSMTIAENLTLAKLRTKTTSLKPGVKKEWRAEFAALLEPLGLGLEKRLDEKIDLLSGGQKQTVALLMATMIEPKVLLLDEHTAALDPKVSERVLKITNQIVQEKRVTTLMITHNIHHALEYGNRLILLERGQIGFEASGEEKKKLTVLDIISRLESRTESDVKLSRASRTERKEENKDKILTLFQTKDQITNNDVETLLGVSDATATRYLDELEKGGKVIQIGKTGKAVTYKLK